jgi:hypothetical protein
MSERQDDLQQRIIAFARSVEAPDESFLVRRIPLADADQINSVIDGMTLALISFCYHQHPRGPNVHEIMEKLDKLDPDSSERSDLEHQADEAAALQIPFIVTLNRIVEDYYDLRCQLEAELIGND